MKLTRHNGRAGRNGIYNPKHNDRRFDVANSEHIDTERTKQNIYWDCYTGFSSALARERGGENDYSFERIEQLYYFEHYADHVHILDWALHLDEGTPHIHERHVFDCENKYGELCPSRRKHWKN